MAVDSMSDLEPVWAIHGWHTNADLIADVARLNYLRDTDTILDVTWGYGNFWRRWRPERGALLGIDIDPRKSLDGRSYDMRDLSDFESRSFDVVVIDGPYKLNGTPDPTLDERYGIHLQTSVYDRIRTIESGIREGCRLARRLLLVKCQDRVCSGRIVWQTDIFTRSAMAHGFRKLDRFDMIGHCRPQPHTRQVHAYGRGSTLLLFEKI